MAVYKAKAYANALVAALLDKKASEKEIAANFVALLQKNQDTKKAKEILALAQAMLLKKTGNKKVVLEIARKADTAAILKKFVRKGDVVEEKINPGMVAGVKILVDGDAMLDFSLVKKLENIF